VTQIIHFDNLKLAMYAGNISAFAAAAAIIVLIVTPLPSEWPITLEPDSPAEDDYAYWLQLRALHDLPPLPTISTTASSPSRPRRREDLRAKKRPRQSSARPVQQVPSYTQAHSTAGAAPSPRTSLDIDRSADDSGRNGAVGDGGAGNGGDGAGNDDGGAGNDDGGGGANAVRQPATSCESDSRGDSTLLHVTDHGGSNVPAVPHTPSQAQQLQPASPLLVRPTPPPPASPQSSPPPPCRSPPPSEPGKRAAARVHNKQKSVSPSLHSVGYGHGSEPQRRLEIRLEPREIVVRRRADGAGDDAASREQRDVLSSGW